MTLSENLSWRGFVNQTTYKDITVLDKDPITFYWGVDPSAESMHIGQLSLVMMIRHFIDAGHHPVLLVGGATGLIGDPDGKDEERQLKSEDEVERNKQGIINQYQHFFENIEVVDNYDWFKGINYISFLREVGKHFSMSQLLDREFVKSRVGQDGKGISYAEFSYSLIQGYDYLHLFREKGTTLQISGADQWGNSLSGVELVRKIESQEVNVWTAPLVINKSTNKKFGKSEDGAVWLDENKTSAFKFYQFWLNTDDAGVIDYLKLYTMFSKVEIDALARQTQENPNLRTAQKALAFETTKIVHGESRAKSVENVIKVLLGTAEVESLSPEDLNSLSREIPTVKAGISVQDALLEAGYVDSNGAARRLIDGGGVSINNSKISSDQVTSATSIIKKGKNNYILVVA